MQMRVHAPAAIAVFNDGRLRNVRSGTRISIGVNPELRRRDRSCRFCCIVVYSYACASARRNAVTTSATRDWFQSKLRFRLYCPTAVSTRHAVSHVVSTISAPRNRFPPSAQITLGAAVPRFCPPLFAPWRIIVTFAVELVDLSLVTFRRVSPEQFTD